MSKWIPVSKRLPKECEAVLTYNPHSNHGKIEAGFWYEVEDKKRRWEIGEDLWGFDAVTHWMPLPEPPK